MIRTQIQLTEEQSAALKELAAREKVSVAALIRRGMDYYLRVFASVSDEERRQRALAIAGRFRTRVSDLSTNHDRYLAEDYDS